MLEILSGSQLVWQSLHPNQHLSPLDGRCNICGGRLIGKPKLKTDFMSNSWTTEAFVRCKHSLYICQPCAELQTFLKTQNGRTLPFGFIATRERFKLFESPLDIDETLCDLPDEYVLYLATINLGKGYQKHTVYDSIVGYNRTLATAMLFYPAWPSGKGAMVAHMIVEFDPIKAVECSKLMMHDEWLYRYSFKGIDEGIEYHMAYSLARFKALSQKKEENKHE